MSNPFNPSDFIEERVREFEENFYHSGDCVGLRFDDKLSGDIAPVCYCHIEEQKKYLRSSLQDLLAEVLKNLPPERIVHSYIPSENTPENKGWNDYRNEAIKALLNPKKESPLEKEDREEYAQALEDEAGELNKQHHY